MYHKDPLKIDPLAQHRGFMLTKPFKTPALATSHQREQPTRKRKRVSYKENAIDDEDKGRGSKRRQDDTYCDALSDAAPNINRAFPIYDAKPSEEVFSKRFSIPTIKGKDGKPVTVAMSRASLGVRPVIKLLPRPLHDPMADHAVVLYDPTIDYRETDEERLERLREEEKEKARKEALDKVSGMHNPHRSLREILGESTSNRKVSERVPVVIDPLLSKILRPHQVEGVRVSGFPDYAICYVAL